MDPEAMQQLMAQMSAAGTLPRLSSSPRADSPPHPRAHPADGASKSPTSPPADTTSPTPASSALALPTVSAAATPPVSLSGYAAAAAAVAASQPTGDVDMTAHRLDQLAYLSHIQSQALSGEAVVSDKLGASGAESSVSGSRSSPSKDPEPLVCCKKDEVKKSPDSSSRSYSGKGRLQAVISQLSLAQEAPAADSAPVSSSTKDCDSTGSVDASGKPDGFPATVAVSRNLSPANIAETLMSLSRQPDLSTVSPVPAHAVSGSSVPGHPVGGSSVPTHPSVSSTSASSKARASPGKQVSKCSPHSLGAGKTKASRHHIKKELPVEGQTNVRAGSAKRFVSSPHISPANPVVNTFPLAFDKISNVYDYTLPDRGLGSATAAAAAAVTAAAAVRFQTMPPTGVMMGYFPLATPGWTMPAPIIAGTEVGEISTGGPLDLSSGKELVSVNANVSNDSSNSVSQKTSVAEKEMERPAKNCEPVKEKSRQKSKVTSRDDAILSCVKPKYAKNVLLFGEQEIEIIAVEKNKWIVRNESELYSLAQREGAKHRNDSPNSRKQFTTEVTRPTSRSNDSPCAEQFLSDVELRSNQSSPGNSQSAVSAVSQLCVSDSRGPPVPLSLSSSSLADDSSVLNKGLLDGTVSSKRLVDDAFSNKRLSDDAAFNKGLLPNDAVYKGLSDSAISNKRLSDSVAVNKELSETINKRLPEGSLSNKRLSDSAVSFVSSAKLAKRRESAEYVTDDAQEFKTGERSSSVVMVNAGLPSQAPSLVPVTGRVDESNDLSVVSENQVHQKCPVLQKMLKNACT